MLDSPQWQQCTRDSTWPADAGPTVNTSGRRPLKSGGDAQEAREGGKKGGVGWAGTAREGRWSGWVQGAREEAGGGWREEERGRLSIGRSPATPAAGMRRCRRSACGLFAVRDVAS